MKIKSAQQGHAHLMLFVAVGFALVGFVGFNVYKNKSNQDGLSYATTKVATAAEKKATSVRFVGPNTSDKKHVIGYLEVTAPDGGVKKSSECSNTRVNVRATRGDVTFQFDNQKLSFISAKKSASSKAYCAYRVQLETKYNAVGEWKMSANLKSSKAFKEFSPEKQEGAISIVKKDVEITVTKVLDKNDPKTKGVFGYVEVKAAGGGSLQRRDCSGTVKGVEVVSASSTDKNLYKKKQDLPLRYVQQTKPTTLNDGHGYCASKLKPLPGKESTLPKASDMRVKLTFQGNDFLNAKEKGLLLPFRNVTAD